jgi:hypothetical protein
MDLDADLTQELEDLEGGRTVGALLGPGLGGHALNDYRVERFAMGVGHAVQDGAGEAAVDRVDARNLGESGVEVRVGGF